MTIRMTLNLALAALLGLCASCTTNGTLPTAKQLDAYERQIRETAQPDYAALEEQRASGQLSQDDYAAARTELDQRVQNKVDTMAWSRHALAQSELKSLGIPTPDQPVENVPPGLGQTQGSLYNNMRTTGMGQMPTGGGGGGGGQSLGTHITVGSGGGTGYVKP